MADKNFYCPKCKGVHIDDDPWRLIQHLKDELRPDVQSVYAFEARQEDSAAKIESLQVQLTLAEKVCEAVRDNPCDHVNEVARIKWALDAWNMTRNEGGKDG